MIWDRGWLTALNGLLMDSLPFVHAHNDRLDVDVLLELIQLLRVKVYNGHLVLTGRQHKPFILTRAQPKHQQEGHLSGLTLFVFSNQPLTSRHRPNARAITQLPHTARNTGDSNPPAERPVKKSFTFSIYPWSHLCRRLNKKSRCCCCCCLCKWRFSFRQNIRGEKRLRNFTNHIE